MALARRSVFGLAAGAAATSWAVTTVASASVESGPAGAVPDPTTATLRQLARHTKLEIGTAVDTSALRNDAP